MLNSNIGLHAYRAENGNGTPIYISIKKNRYTDLLTMGADRNPPISIAPLFYLVILFPTDDDDDRGGVIVDQLTASKS